MERYNFKVVEKNGKNFGTKIKLLKQKLIKIRKNFIV